MPIIAIFINVVIRINFRDHAPPHLHAQYKGFEGLYAIRTRMRIAGRLPRNIERRVQQWMTSHSDELMENWDLASRREPTFKIAGADHDD